MEADPPECDSKISNEVKHDFDCELEKEFEDDVSNATAVRMKLWEAQALDSSVGVEHDIDETALLFEDTLQERDHLVSALSS